MSEGAKLNPHTSQRLHPYMHPSSLSYSKPTFIPTTLDNSTLTTYKIKLKDLLEFDCLILKHSTFFALCKKNALQICSVHA
jgi:hypothetical protein